MAILAMPEHGQDARGTPGADLKVSRRIPRLFAAFCRQELRLKSALR